MFFPYFHRIAHINRFRYSFDWESRHGRIPRTATTANSFKTLLHQERVAGGNRPSRAVLPGSLPFQYGAASKSCAGSVEEGFSGATAFLVRSTRVVEASFRRGGAAAWRIPFSIIRVIAGPRLTTLPS